MFDLEKLRSDFQNCPCGQAHDFATKDVVIESGAVNRVGEILKKNGFGKKLLFIADNNTLKAADGILESLKDFELTKRIYPDLRVANYSEVKILMEILKDLDAVISVGTGSLNDICRRAAYETDKPLCIFGTAASMDGFASYGAPLIDGNLKSTFDAKSPEVIIADTKILAKAPAELKSAGFGDMIGKYIGLIDWKVSNIVSGEKCCEKVFDLTRQATDRIMSLADKITADDEESAAAVFEALLLTGFGMSFVRTSRPASGTEHIVSHFWECKKLLDGKISDFHGKKVGVATLHIMKFYQELIKKEKITTHPENVDWDDIYSHYDGMLEEVIKLNTPTTITDGIDPKVLEEKWDEIKEIVRSVPTYEQMLDAMKRAGCATTCAEIEVSPELEQEGLKYHPYMRRRLSLRRLSNMID